MILRFGYADASGEFYITLDSEKCDGCGLCAEVCPKGVFFLAPNPFDPQEEVPLALVYEDSRNRLRYLCIDCKGSPKPCVASCPNGALAHF